VPASSQKPFDAGLVAPGLRHPPRLNPPDGVRQSPLLTGRPVAQSTGFTFQDRQVRPGIEERLSATKAAGMLGQELLIRHDLDASGIGP
jgi:hypothetical protein